MASSRPIAKASHRRDFLKIGAAGLLGLTPAAAAAAGGAGQRRRHGRATGAGRRRSSWSGSPAARPPSTCGTSSPNAPEGIRGEFKPDRHQRRRRPDLRAPAARWPRSMDKVHHRPLAGPHDPVARPGHGLHDHRQQADAGPAVSRRSARWSPSCCPPTQGVPPYVTFSELRNGAAGLAGYLGTAYNPFIVEGAGAGGNGARPDRRQPPRPRHHAADRLHPRRAGEPRPAAAATSTTASQTSIAVADLVDGLDAFHQQALDILRSDKTKKAFDLDQETAGAARPLRQQRRSARAPWRPAGWSRPASASSPSASAAGTRTARTSTPCTTRLLPQLDQTLSALIEDLDDRGMLDSTIVYCAGEFGRTPKINKNAGRDHWARSMAVRAGRRRLQARLRPRHHRRQRHGPGHRARARRTTSPSTIFQQPRHRPAHGTADPDRPADQPLPRRPRDPALGQLIELASRAA